MGTHAGGRSVDPLSAGHPAAPPAQPVAEHATAKLAKLYPHSRQVLRTRNVTELAGMNSSIVAAPQPEACASLDSDMSIVAAAQPDKPEACAEPEACASDADDDCCVCLEALRPSKMLQQPQSLLVTECGHTFHFRCILNSCRQRKQPEPTCPLCRHTLELGPLLLAIPESVPKRRTCGGQRLPPRIVGTDGAATRPRIQQWRYHFATGVIKGVVSDYPGHEDGAPISTSRVARAEGDSICITQSGSRYELGDPHPEWQQQMEQRGLWDPAMPLSQLARWIREREMPNSAIASEMDRNSDSDDDSDDA